MSRKGLADYKQRVLTLNQEQEICKAYEAGGTLMQLGKRFDVHYSTVRNTLLRHKVEIRSQGMRVGTILTRKRGSKYG